MRWLHCFLDDCHQIMRQGGQIYVVTSAESGTEGHRSLILESQHFSLPKSPLSYSFIEVEVEKGAIQARG